jgi:hypothetical protein
MPSYKADLLFRLPGEWKGYEDLIEGQLQSALYDLGVTGITGCTVYQVFPHV